MSKNTVTRVPLFPSPEFKQLFVAQRAIFVPKPNQRLSSCGLCHNQADYCVIWFRHWNVTYFKGYNKKCPCLHEMWRSEAVTLSWFFSREGEKPKNPMVELFYGRFLAVGVHEGETGCLIETNKEKKRGTLGRITEKYSVSIVWLQQPQSKASPCP